MENESLVKLETAFLAQEKSFNWLTVFGLDSFNRIRAKVAHNREGSFISWDKHDHNLRLPSQAVLQKWLREKHNIDICIQYWRGNNKPYKPVLHYFENGVFRNFFAEHYSTYEEALEVGLQEALKLIENGNK
jgi:hypothetical protein